MTSGQARGDHPSVPTTAGRLLDRGKLEWLARVGLVSRGVVYAVIGVLAVKVAIGAGGRTDSQRGALEDIAHQPFGQLLLVVLAIGLAAYAGWRLTGAVAGSPGDEHDVQHRVSGFGSALVYGVLCVTTIKIFAGSRTRGGSSAARHATAGVLGWPGGPAIVAVAGCVVLGVGIYHAYKGFTRKFLKESRTAEMSEGVRRTFTALGVFGHVALAVTSTLVAYGVIKAAIDYSPRSAIGLDGALRKLAQSSYGPVLLAIVALGFIGFGLYSIVDARYHKSR